MKEKVSILSANYNNGGFLDDFFDSISKQTYENIEVVIVDDASSDNSDSIIKNWTGKLPFHIEYISLNENVGFANALNIGLKYCSGKYIARLDPDDFISNNRIEMQVKYLLENKDVSMVGSNAKYYQNDSGNFIGSSNFIKNSDWIVSKYRDAEYGMMHGTILFRKECFLNVNYNQSHVPAEDYALISRMIVSGCKPANIDEELTFVRIHSSSVSNNLPFSTIIKLFILRNEIFNIDFDFINIMFKYLHFKFYRKFLSERKYFVRLFFYFCLHYSLL